MSKLTLTAGDHRPGALGDIRTVDVLSTTEAHQIAATLEAGIYSIQSMDDDTVLSSTIYESDGKDHWEI